MDNSLSHGFCDHHDMIRMMLMTDGDYGDGDDCVDDDVDGDTASQITMQDTLGMHCTPDDGLLLAQR